MVAIGLPHHITQRGNAGQDVFTTDAVRHAYLELLSEHAAGNRLRLLACCLMTNHVHIVAVPEADSSMANTFRHAHGRVSQYWNTDRNRTGHLWQNRYYSCPVEELSVCRVMAYVEKQPGAGWHGGTRGRFRMVERGRAPGQDKCRCHAGYGVVASALGPGGLARSVAGAG